MDRVDGEGERRGIFAFPLRESGLLFFFYVSVSRVEFFSFSLFFFFGALALFLLSKKKKRTRQMSKPGGRSALTAALTGGEGTEAAPASAAAAGSHVRLDAAAFPCLASVLGKSSKPVLAGAAAAAAAAASDTVGELSSGFERVKLRGNDVLAGSAPTAHLLPDGSAAVSGGEKRQRWELVWRLDFFSSSFAFSLLSFVTDLGHALSTLFLAYPKLLLPEGKRKRSLLAAEGPLRAIDLQRGK